MKINRRQFLQLALVECVSLQACTTQPFFEFNTENIELNKILISINNLNPYLKDYKIGFISDIHLGPYVSKHFLIKALEILKQNKIDLLLLGGDYINLPEPGLIRSTFGVLREPDYNVFKDSIKYLSKKVFNDLALILKQYSPKDGIVGIYGNHDRWVNQNDCQESFSKNNISLLKNDKIIINRKNAQIEIAGVDDYWTGIPCLDKVVSSLKKDSVKILLNHNPDYISVQSKKYNNNFDLILSGHTHGGQIRLPGVGALVTNTKDHNFVSGLNKIGKSNCYTSRGLGVVEIPHRINCKPEINIFTLN